MTRPIIYGDSQAEGATLFQLACQALAVANATGSKVDFVYDSVSVLIWPGDCASTVVRLYDLAATAANLQFQLDRFALPSEN